MKIFDCFTFYNEFDILEIRLHELYPIVDHFVVVEATKTYAGRDKPLHFADNRERFAAYADKIIHVVVDDLPAEASDHWAREYAQRNGIERGLTLAAPGDLVIVSDVDEIIRREVIEKIRATGTAPAVLGFRLRVYSMRFNYQNILGPEAHIVWPVAMRRDQLTSPQEARNSRFDLDRANDGSVIDDAGWHYTSVGNDEWIRNKIANFSHSEFHDPAFITQVNPNQLLARGLDLFGRNGRNIFEGKDFIWAIVPPPPLLVREQPERFAKYFAPAPEDALEKAFQRMLIDAANNSRQLFGWTFIEKVLLRLFRFFRKKSFPTVSGRPWDINQYNNLPSLGSRSRN